MFSYCWIIWIILICYIAHAYDFMLSSVHSSVLTSTNSSSQTTTHLVNHHFVQTVHQLLKATGDIKGRSEMSGRAACEQLTVFVVHICPHL